MRTPNTRVCCGNFRKVPALCFALFSMLLVGGPLIAQTYNMSTAPVTTCSGTFYDPGGSAGNYSNSQNVVQTFTSANGNRISFTFTAFSTEYGYDYLEVYDGPSTSYPMVARYHGSSLPPVITSSGTSLTFKFTSDGGVVASGWAATIACTTAPLPQYNMSSGTVVDCSGMFYDSGGPAGAYAANEDIVETFTSANGEFLRAQFAQTAFSLGSGDSLFIFDGTSTTSPPVAVYVQGSNAETITSSGTSLTFRFRSNATGTNNGWSVQISCVSTAPPSPVYLMSSGIRYTCSGTFYDDGGTGNYSETSRVQTFGSPTGDRLSFNFTTFSLHAGESFTVYDGPSSSYPLIGTWVGSIANPGIITSTGTYLTFVFTTDNGGTTTTGWAASISCAAPALTQYVMSSGSVNACSGVFYDSGGPSGAYASNTDITQTFCSANGQHIQFTFNAADFNIGFGDSLFIYDGAGTSAQLMTIHVGGSNPETVTSSGTCLTFRFKSNGTSNASGWQAVFSCTSSIPPSAFSISAGVRYTCNATFYDNGGTAHYNDFEDNTQTFISAGGCALQVSFSAFDTYNTSDALSIYDGASTAAPLIGTWGGSWVSPGTIQASGNALTFVFNTNNASSTGPGWTASFSCPNQTIAPTITSNAPVCAGSALNLSASSVAGATYSWTGPNGFSSTAQNPVISNVTPAEAGTYTVTATSGSCTSNMSTVNVAVNPVPPVPVASNDGPVCEGSIVHLYVDTIAGATYSWSGPNGFTSTIQDAVISNISLADTGTYVVTVSAGSCSSQAITSVAVHPAPAAPIISWNQTAGTLSSNYTTGNQWYLNGNPLPGETQQDLYYAFYSSGGPYTVAYTDSTGCSASSAPYTIITTGISSIEKEEPAYVYPNPSDGNFMIILHVPAGTYEMRMLDVTGRLAFYETIDVGIDALTKEMHNDLAPGVYELTLRSGKRVITVPVFVR